MEKEEVKSSKWRDFLLQIEKEMQAEWEASWVYEANAP